MSTRVVVIGLDGVAWHLLDPLIDAGHMPRLAALRAGGSWGSLQSTIPTYTPPAWTSAVTGVNPGRHGIYGFVAGNAQAERQELVHAGRIRAPSIWEIVNAQQARAGIYNVPLTYPPRPLSGWMVSGMMTPGYGERRTGFASWDGPGGGEALEEHILRWVPDYACDLSANWERDWRDTVLCEAARDSLEQRHRALAGLLELDPPDLVFAVLETPDRLQHVYYRYLDPADSMYGSPEGERIRSCVTTCFESVDRIVGLLDDYAGRDGAVIVCSDHGFTAWDASVHTNALLASWGYLKLKRSARVLQTPLARWMVPIAKRMLPAKTAREAKVRTFAAIDWSKTKAFASPIPQQGIFVNLKGRERFGIVPPTELAALKDEIVRHFEGLRGPQGRPVTERVFRAEDVFYGEALDGAPDLLPVLMDHRFELDDEIFHTKPFTDQSHLPRGVHHPDGVVVIAGAGVTPGRIAGSIVDVTPTALYMGGFKVPEGIDGSVIEPAFSPEHRDAHPIATTAAPAARTGRPDSPYSEEEEATIEESLRGLGYL
jgi:predicted AlkP superfamily phosphohydrolase/phosphomutase